MITPREFEWAAAFLLGEGHFGRTRTTIRITAAQVELWPLEKLQRLFGGKIYPRPPQRSETTGLLRAPVSYWIVLGAQAAGLAMSLFGLMSPKRKAEIAAALHVWRAAPTAPKYRTHCPQGHEYTDDNIYLKARTRAGSIHRLCRTCRKEESALVSAEARRRYERASRAKRPEHYRDILRRSRLRRRVASVLLEAM